jgi:hypothetical protein
VFGFGWLKKEKKPLVVEEVLSGYVYIRNENGQLKIHIKWWPRDWPQPDPGIEGIDWSKGEEIIYTIHTPKDGKRIRRELKDATIKDVKIVENGLWLDLEAKDYIFL